MKTGIIATLAVALALSGGIPGTAEDEIVQEDSVTYPITESDAEIVDESVIEEFVDEEVVDDTIVEELFPDEVVKEEIFPRLTIDGEDIPVGTTVFTQDIGFYNVEADWSAGGVISVDGDIPDGFTFDNPESNEGIPTIDFSGTATEDNVGAYPLELSVLSKADSTIHILGTFVLSVYAWSE